jgi:hypothetical protein
MAEEWCNLYEEVVWAKFGSYWWPSFVYNPNKLPITCTAAVKEKACKQVGKSYIVYFYADNSYGFAVPSTLKPFNEETKKLVNQTNIAKKYIDSFPKAVNLALDQVLLPKHDRVSWHYSAPEVVEKPDCCAHFDEGAVALNEEASTNQLEVQIEWDKFVVFVTTCKTKFLMHNDVAGCWQKARARETKKDRFKRENCNNKKSKKTIKSQFIA